MVMDLPVLIAGLGLGLGLGLGFGVGLGACAVNTLAVLTFQGAVFTGQDFHLWCRLKNRFVSEHAFSMPPERDA